MKDDDLQAILPQVYDELLRLARRMHRERGATMHATSVVHEAFLRLSRSESARWESRAHFLALAARAMRFVLADRARRRSASKRGGDVEHVTLVGVGFTEQTVNVIALNQALDDLTAIDERVANGVQMRLLAGMTTQEIADVTELSVSTVERDWKVGRAWLVDRLSH